MHDSFADNVTLSLCINQVHFRVTDITVTAYLSNANTANANTIAILMA